MALCKIKQKKFEDALKIAEKAVIADSKYIKGYYRRATAYIKLGNRLEGCLDLKRILEIDEDNVQVKNELEKVKAKLNEEEKKIVNEYNEGFKRVEIEEGEDSDSDSDTDSDSDSDTDSDSEKEIVVEKKEEVSDKDKELSEFVKKLQVKKDKITKEIKAGLFEGCMVELAENISEAEEKRNEYFGMDKFHVGYTLLNRKKMGKLTINHELLNKWISESQMTIPLKQSHPNLHLLLELELSLKSNLCYCFKQISQAKNLIFLASNLLELSASMMRSPCCAVKGNQIFQKTIKRRALGLEQNEDFKNSFRDFWVARAFDSMDSVIVNGLNRSKQELGKDGMKETKVIEKEFEGFLTSFKKGEQKEEKKEDTTSSSSVFETVTQDEIPMPSKDVITTSFKTSPEKSEPVQEEKQEVVEDDKIIPETVEEEKENKVEIVEEKESKADPKKTESESDNKPNEELNIFEVSLNSTQLDQLEEMKLMGNSCFKRKDLKGAINEFTKCIKKLIKGNTSEYLQGKP